MAQTSDELRSDIQRTREEMGDTVEARRTRPMCRPGPKNGWVRRRTPSSRRSAEHLRRLAD